MDGEEAGPGQGRLNDISKREEINQLEEVFRRFQKNINGVWNKRGIHISRTNVILLNRLQTEGPQKISALAEHLCITSGAVTGISDKLIEAGLAERSRSAEDRRIVYLGITEKGREILVELKERRQTLLNDLFGDIPQEDIQHLIELFRHLSDKAEKLTGE
ncbi:MarR family transcriptional regulator [Paenibacillus sp. J31TS4]|uniref:MarR family winged helix-turn-helix transcriptional regulator n=1 Tax=Paenibacillus sp. J31TS4 TaxID=2807195 RepID=UPI001B041268|nr:MarR family transcriptional regulator [Paenibacillus sp. J31TS4]GIP37421.1 MarR family transcriptional regulator [Paenibacillus sp. J31TS4]